ncbi:M20 family metallopeptidase [Planctomycetes bacterium TBK1r]|uniref:Acetylornithine deacetylase n=1 Tax=Stieleria magnilauensis TaxID=2527963 RepID=A0ABX5Y520_9BACT|nr:Acetylornithine deacetylase [Planctomycetes bacterium TBK1r]
MPHSIEASPPDGTIASAIATLEKLISFPSVSAKSNVDINDWCAATLAQMGFTIWRSGYRDERSVRKANLVAVRNPVGTEQHETSADHRAAAASHQGLAYFCHTDVVPAKKWVGAPTLSSPSTDDAAKGPFDAAGPFDAVVSDDRVYGRGACDMKGSLAAMLSAVARVDARQQTAPIWMVCTADEEVGFNGAKHLVDHCDGYRELVRADPVSVIGEPTEMNVVYAHKGIQGFTVHSRGRAGHSATNFGINANEAMVPMLVKLLELCRRTRDDAGLQDDRFDPPVLSWNFGVSDHSNVVNITPERSDAWVSFRTMPEVDATELVAEANATARRLGLTVTPIAGCDPLWTDPDSEIVSQFQAIAGTRSQTVCYATDGGVLGELSRRIVIGPGSIAQAHTVDEWIAIDQLSRGIDCYEKALRHWCTDVA